MATLAERCKAAGLSSAAELTRITGTSKETLTNWMKDKPVLFEVVLKGASPVFEPVFKQVEQVEPEQQWCFSAEDLQEQAKLIERLTEENQRLEVELRISKRRSPWDIELTPENLEMVEKHLPLGGHSHSETVNYLLSLLLTNRQRDDYEQQISDLQAKLAQAEYSAEERGKKWNAEQKTVSKLQDKEAFMNEKIAVLMQEINELKALKDKRGKTPVKTLKQKIHLGSDGACY